MPSGGTRGKGDREGDLAALGPLVAWLNRDALVTVWCQQMAFSQAMSRSSAPMMERGPPPGLLGGAASLFFPLELHGGFCLSVAVR